MDMQATRVFMRPFNLSACPSYIPFKSFEIEACIYRLFHTVNHRSQHALRKVSDSS